MEALEEKLQQLIEVQNFEEAVNVRDEIKVLKEGGDTHVE
ncbi:MAG: UvrB/UvrC motif-containing protein [Macrococcoides caseolyticum]